MPLTFVLEDLSAFTARNVGGYAFLVVFGGAFAAVVGWAAVGQKLTVLQLAGAAVVLAAMVVAQTRTQTDVREIRT
ncbi:hypothetical protein JNUCC0626_15200 [Lentzea sp. JNUCC 0626]|uniref:hypothetical protein n=1 Tax=Lentzea sp. JNUCC 0626 TaxID=3367513 RepID=UPI00374861FC